jgi:hypothetical protein
MNRRYDFFFFISVNFSFIPKFFSFSGCFSFLSVKESSRQLQPIDRCLDWDGCYLEGTLVLRTSRVVGNIVYCGIHIGI